MDVLPPDARESLVEAMQTAAGDGNVTLAGAYDHAAVPGLMANVDWVVVPSRWWENSPLVIQEAFMHGRPVICSDIGGMKEKVTHGVNGLHFTVSNPGSLVGTITHAVTTPGLWDKLHAGIPAIFSMDEHMSNLARIYGELLDRHLPPPPQPELIPTAG
jgi:glycosyltransferase involved in cell wall biosynthesis